MRPLATLAIALFLAGCGTPEHVQRAEATLLSLRAQRESGAITWRAWAVGFEAAFRERAGGGPLPSDVSAILANTHVIAQRVDTGRMTANEGHAALQQMVADAERAERQDRALSNLAAPRRPLFVNCYRHGIFTNCIGG